MSLALSRQPFPGPTFDLCHCERGRLGCTQDGEWVGGWVNEAKLGGGHLLSL